MFKPVKSLTENDSVQRLAAKSGAINRRLSGRILGPGRFALTAEQFS